jgi:hypothetical protein
MFRYRDKERLLFSSPSMHCLEPAGGIKTSLRSQIAAEGTR